MQGDDGCLPKALDHTHLQPQLQPGLQPHRVRLQLGQEDLQVQEGLGVPGVHAIQADPGGIGDDVTREDVAIVRETFAASAAR